MATKRLRSMVFPGLTDSYTVPEKLTELEDFNTFAGSSIAIVSDGDTHVIIPADMYVYIHGHETLSDGLYQNISGASISANATLSNENVNLVSGGGLNALRTSLTGLDTSLSSLENGLLIIVDGDTVPAEVAVPVDGYAYIKNNTHGLAEGLYKNTSASAFPYSGGTADSYVFTPEPNILNAFNTNITQLLDQLLTSSAYNGNLDNLPTGFAYCSGTATNKPTSSGYFTVTIRRSTYWAQLALGRSEAKVYYRNFTSSTWGSWVELAVVQ